MKILIRTGLILLLSIQLLSQTTDEIPGPERVLVVYKKPIEDDSTSYKIMSHYVDRRNIPFSNIVEIENLPIEVTYPGEGTVTLEQEGEDLRGDGKTGWLYVDEYLADPIEYYLNNTYVEEVLLKDKIRFIVLCKGLPLKVRMLPYVWNDGARHHVSVEGV